MAAAPTADVVIVGAGPAGAATALMLAPFHRTLLVDRADRTGQAAAARIGESLPAAARRLLRDMGLWPDFVKEGHASCNGARSLWGGSEPVFADSIRDPEGPGWHLDRSRFDAWLLRSAARRGAALVIPAQATSLTPIQDGWQLILRRHGRPLAVTARFVVDAGGRAAPLAKVLGRNRRDTDRLACSWCHGSAARHDGTTVTIAEREGWWYTAPLPGDRRVLAFHTDADLPAARGTAGTDALLAHARAQPELLAVLAAADFQPAGEAGYCAAHSVEFDVSAGSGWLAVGDAALACDPLSSQGLFNALYSGLMAADALRQALAGDAVALTRYDRHMARLSDAYRKHLAAWYGMEMRWPDAPFWRRRHRHGAGAALQQHRKSAATSDFIG